MDFSETGLKVAGFLGFVAFADLPTTDVPREPGVYVVLRTDTEPPCFREHSPAGRFKAKDPSVDQAALERAWVPGAAVIYIGKAGRSGRAARGLMKRLDEYRRHGSGQRIGHWGGRYIWQLADSDQLLAAWKTTPDQNPEDVESQLIHDFESAYGCLPFANLSGDSGSRPARQTADAQVP